MNNLWFDVQCILHVHGTQNPKILVLNLYLDIVVLLVSLVTVGRHGLSVVT